MFRSRVARNKRLATGIVVSLVLIGGATTVNALSSNGSERLSQGPGVVGSVEVGDYFGGALAIGDFDNDGEGDVIAGAAFENFGSRPDVGLVHVLYGTPSGLSGGNDRTIHQGTKGVPGKAESDDRFGSAVAVGDFDNDGYDDAIVGVVGEDTKTKVDAGGFTILYGSSNGLRGYRSKTYTAASRGVRGPAEPYGNLGEAVAVGDFDDDGYDDVAIGAPGAGPAGREGSGAVHVLYGGPKGIRPSGDQRLHQSATGVDGTRDAGDAFGSSLAVGDFDRDGHDDLAVGIPGETTDGVGASGAVQVFSGGANGLELSSGRLITQASGDLTSDVAWDELFGASLAAGDFDGNGRDDLAVGSPGESTSGHMAAGMVHVLYGSKSGLRVTGTTGISQGTAGIDGAVEPGDEFGRTLASGDFNNNGRVDLAIGVPGEGHGQLNGAGMVHVLFGSKRGIRPDLHQQYRPGHQGIPGSAMANGGFSRALATGDIDGDGRADLVVGAPSQMVSGDASAGAITVIFG